MGYPHYTKYRGMYVIHNVKNIKRRDERKKKKESVLPYKIQIAIQYN